MSNIVFDSTAPKKPANVSVNADLLAQAKALNINLSQALEGRLAELVAEKKRQAWLEENREAIEAYNERVRAEGVFGDGLRVF